LAGLGERKLEIMKLLDKNEEFLYLSIEYCDLVAQSSN